jgi:hypothetical protein
MNCSQTLDELVAQYDAIVGDQGEYELMKETIRSVEDQLTAEKLRVRALEGLCTH